jgi:DNA-binding LacI/PurR family transcriptional regulator
LTEKDNLIVPNVKSPFFEQVSGGLNQAARELKVSASLTGPDSYDPEVQRQEFKRITTSKPSGILVSVADPKVLTPEIDSAVAAGRELANQHQLNQLLDFYIDAEREIKSVRERGGCRDRILR